MSIDSRAIGPLLPADLRSALRLSTAAGWGQLEADWQRLLDLWPQLCLAGRIDGQLIATATVTQYETTSWVGMILVDERRRGTGIGGAMFDAALRAAAGVGIQTLGLDATDLGRPVYLKRGFVDRAVLCRWLCPARTILVDIAPKTSLLDLSDWPAILELDRRACGVDREPLLRHLAAEPGAEVTIDREGTHVAGFAFTRPGRIGRHIGPVIARDLAVARRLVAGIAHQYPEAMVIDTLDVRGWDRELMELGFAPSRQLVRMSLGPVSGDLISGQRVFATAGLELG